jgi:hypothetical protein
MSNIGRIIGLILLKVNKYIGETNARNLLNQNNKTNQILINYFNYFMMGKHIMNYHYILIYQNALLAKKLICY